MRTSVTFRLSASKALQLRVDARNVLNHPCRLIHRIDWRIRRQQLYRQLRADHFEIRQPHISSPPALEFLKSRVVGSVTLRSISPTKIEILCVTAGVIGFSSNQSTLLIRREPDMTNSTPHLELNLSVVYLRSFQHFSRLLRCSYFWQRKNRR